MSDTDTLLSEFLVISRGKWDESLPPEKIQEAIDAFYHWIEGMIDEGKMKPGQRLGRGGATVTQSGITTDGPFGETKEVIGGYWFVMAPNLEEAAKLAQTNPCLPCGLYYELRPTESAKASAFAVTNETPKR